jgi:hypothetical protein
LVSFRKEVIHLEKLTRRQWEKKWGFSRNLMKVIYATFIKANMQTNNPEDLIFCQQEVLALI